MLFEWGSVPEADGQVAGVHAVLGVVFLDLVEVLKTVSQRIFYSRLENHVPE